MYQATQGKKDADVDAADRARREEIQRVAMTMIKLMDVAEPTSFPDKIAKKIYNQPCAAMCRPIRVRDQPQDRQGA
jgi:hypothetical protein